MSKKPRKKKNNAEMRKYKIASIFTDGLGIAQVNQDNCNVMNLATGEKHKNANRHLISQFTDIKHKWTVLLCVFCTESNGKLTLKTDQITLGNRYYQKDLREFLLTEHKAMIDKWASVMTINDIGWIATPMKGVDFDIEQAEKMLCSLGAWDDL